MCDVREKVRVKRREEEEVGKRREGEEMIGWVREMFRRLSNFLVLNHLTLPLYASASRCQGDLSTIMIHPGF